MSTTIEEHVYDFALWLESFRAGHLVRPAELGFPNSMCILPGGRVAFLHFLAPDAWTTHDEQMWLDRLRYLGHRAEVVRTAKAGQQVIQDMVWS